VAPFPDPARLRLCDPLGRAGTPFKVVRRQHPTTSKGVIRDQIIRLTGHTTSANYPGPLRLIEFDHAETKKTYLFLTNQLTWSDVTICQIYKSRWKIETFFRWIKAHLKIKSFFGHSLNAVRWQLLTALCIYLLLAYLQFKAMTDLSLFQIFSKLEKHLFEKTNVFNLLNRQYQFQS
jgi:IS4 transposase